VRASCLLFSGLVSACSFDPPPAAPDAASPDAVPVDADTSCETDDFEGGALDPRWALLAGGMPTYDVAASRLLISDAPLADTPSHPGKSWIYELDLDKGNQIGWRQDLGGADLSVEAELGWASSMPELTQAGIAIADAQGAMAALVGLDDGQPALTGEPSAKIGVAGQPDLGWFGVASETGNVIVRIERRDGVAHIFVDGEEVVSGEARALISYVTIYYVRYRSADGMVFPFGGVEIRRMTVCRGGR